MVTNYLLLYGMQRGNTLETISARYELYLCEDYGSK